MDRDLRIRLLFEAMNKVTGPLRDIAGGSTRAGQALKAAKTELDRLKKSQADVTSFRALKNEMKGTQTQMQAAQGRVAALARQIQSTENPTRKMTAAFNRAKREAAALKTRHGEQATKLQQLRGRMSAAGVSTANLAEQERRLRSETARANDELEQQKRRLTDLNQRKARLTAGREAFSKVQGVSTSLAVGGATSMATGAAMAAPIYGMAREAMSFEDAMADANKVLNLSNEELAAMRKATLDQAKRLPLSPAALMTIKAAGAEMRIAKHELNAFADDAAKMAIAFGMEAGEAGAQMATWRTSFQLSQKEVATLGDQINALTNRMGGNTAAISAIITRIGPLGKVAGVAAAEIAAMAAHLDTNGVQAEVGATGIKNMMLALTKGTAATKQQSAAFQSLGLDATALAKRMQTDAQGAITDILGRIRKLSGDKQSAILTRLFGSESVAAIAPMLSGLDDLSARFSLVGNASAYSGSMTEEFLARMGTTSAQMQLAANSVDVLKIQLGEKLLPMLVEGANRVSAFVDRVSGWVDRNPALVKGLLVVGGALSAVMVVFGGLAIAISGLVAPFAVLAGAAAIFGIGMMPLVGIVLAIVAAIALLGGAVYLIYKNWDGISAFFSGLWASVTGAFAWAWAKIEAYNAYMNSLGARWKQFGRNMVTGLIDGITGMFGELKSTVVNVAGNAAKWFKDKLGIRSPSRVFAGLGGFVMDGLTLGIRNGEDDPIDRLRSLSGRMATAMAIGAAAPGVAVAGTMAAPGSAAAAPAPMTVHISIQQQPGQSAQDLAQAIRRELERLERERAARARSAFADS